MFLEDIGEVMFGRSIFSKVFRGLLLTMGIGLTALVIEGRRDHVAGNQEKIETAFNTAMTGKGYSHEPVKKCAHGVPNEETKTGVSYGYSPAIFGQNAEKTYKVSRNDSVFSVHVEAFKSASGKRDSTVVSKPAFEYIKVIEQSPKI